MVVTQSIKMKKKQVDVYCCQCDSWATEVDEDKYDTNYICYDCTEAIYGAGE